MKCKECDFQNAATAKFCTNCGKSLSRQKINNKYVKNNLKKKQVNHQKAGNMAVSQNTFSIKKLWIGAAIILSTFFIYSLLDSGSRKPNLPRERIMEKISQNLLVEAKVFDIASKFVCACGGCDEDSLDECKCDFAVEEREFIRDYLEKSNTEDVIIQAVNKKYGGLKRS